MHPESLDQFDADRLLDLVEGTLDRDAAAALEAELAAVPGAPEMIRRLREDRGAQGLCLSFEGDWNDYFDTIGVVRNDVLDDRPVHLELATL